MGDCKALPIFDNAVLVAAIPTSSAVDELIAPDSLEWGLWQEMTVRGIEVGQSDNEELRAGCRLGANVSGIESCGRAEAEDLGCLWEYGELEKTN